MSAPASSTAATPTTATRTVCVQVPDWPLLTALEAQRDHTLQTDRAAALLAVMDHHRVLTASASARALGVHAGMKKRSAQATCPNLVLVDRSEDAEAALFETVAAAVDTVAAGVEALRPGALLMPARGPARHAGSEEELAEALINAVADLTGFECTVGIADGPLAAILAARTGRIVRPGEAARYLAPHPIATLLEAPIGHSSRFLTTDVSLPETVDLLQRLGMHTLGDFAALPVRSVTDRFGPAVALLHLLANGQEPTAPVHIRLDQPIQVDRVLDPSLERVDQAAFVAKPMAEELQEQLRRHGAVCTRLTVIARADGGHETARTWRHDGALTTADIVDRVRWQCDGWIQTARLRTDIRTGALTHLQLLPEQVVPAGTHAPALWGQTGQKALRAHRAFTRAQSIAGEQAVLIPAPNATGRLLRDLSATIPWKSEAPAVPTGPWPGRPAAPLPATVFAETIPVQLTDADGADVVVTARGVLSADPTHLTSEQGLPPHLAGTAPVGLTGFSAPEILDQGWWRSADAASAHRGARMQVLLESGLALVLLSERGTWRIEALYD
ncbi:DNA polymerase Y family protein [Helcobacillus sp. ACRRO]|uniref:DNA polymerase Y family protein n=1 Tax=Helcobacillus sp. ACRRO TaxID=2918202 RepID=UPI001EF629EB|nr:DNA polymerase Y family protein [Helcobacillus sp. ACRRO]MCG7426952.1 DNA polymerase Y family protein [Helcobacillus sp. ACRRO]